MLLTLELGIRFLHLVPDNAPITYVAIPGDEGYSPAPGSEGRSMFGIVHRINTLGLRDRERATEKPASTYRVVVVGDFVVYAHGVAQEEGLVAQLERLLQSRGHYDVWKSRCRRLQPLQRKRALRQVRPHVETGPRRGCDLVQRPASKISRSSSYFGWYSGGKRPNGTYPDRWRPQLEASALFTALICTYSMIGQGQSSFDPWLFYPTMELELDRFLVTSLKLGVQVVLTLMSGRSPGAEDYQKLASRLAAYAQLRGISFLGLGNILSESGRHEFFLPNIRSTQMPRATAGLPRRWRH